MKRFLLSCCFLFSFIPCVFAQSGTDEELAQQYYMNKEYDKAVAYYEKVYAKRQSNIVYHNYLDCLIQVKDFKTAEKVIKKQMKLDQNNLILWIDMGNMYKLSRDDKQAKDAYEKGIHKLGTDRSQIIALGQAFADDKNWEFALETYKRGRSLLKDEYPFLFETAAVYKAMGDMVNMTDTYLDALVISPSYVQAVQDALQINVGEYADAIQNTVIKKELLKYIQKYSDNDVFSELLIWMMMQQKNYTDALIQIKAIDKRKHEGGWRIMAFARTCVTNEAYDPAIDAFQYVIDMGAKNDNYLQAKEEQLKAMYQKVVNGGAYTHDQLVDLHGKLKKTLDELTHYAATVSLMQDLANLDAFYLYDYSDADSLLKEAMDIPGVSPVARAHCMIQLADILVASGKVWQASLLYSKVEGSFKHEPIGDEAKLKNATIYYYTGNFKWAKAEFDILKGATSKLTANDAMAMALLLEDNMQDTAFLLPLHVFARAQLLDFENREDSALILIDSVYRITTTRTLKEEILLMQAQMAEKKGNYDQAIVYYLQEIKDYADGMLPDKALFYLAKLVDRKQHNPDKATDYYKQIILHYPGSFFVEEARERYRQLSKTDAAPVN
jgi:tetratricopeptide (TPR) repeat protein